jgi:hypothetical protein
VHSRRAQIALPIIKGAREEVGEEQFHAWLTEDFGSHAAQITEALDKEAISSP